MGLGAPADVERYAHDLYAMLRAADARELDVVLAVVPDGTGLGGRGGGPPAARRGRGDVTAPPIGVFDSGLGGLTVLRALIDLLPDERIVYFGDTGRFPYGPKPREEVLAHALEITDVLLGHDVKALVVACNSAAAAALDPLREQLTIPVIGVIEPGLRAAARATRSGRVGVIGTVGTIASGAYQRIADEQETDHRAHVRRLPRVRGIRRGGRRRLGPGARVGGAAAGAGLRGRRRHARARVYALPAAWPVPSAT